MELDDEEMLSVWERWMRSEQAAMSNEEKQEVRGMCKKHTFNTIDESFKVSKGSRITRVI